MRLASLPALLLCFATVALAQNPRNPMQQANDAAEEVAVMTLAPMTSLLPPSPAPAPPHQADSPARISGGVMAGQILTRVDPIYPPEARTNKIEGAVVLSATIGKDGNVEDLSVVTGPALLTAPAIDAVKQWTYRPYLLNGAPVEVRTTITVNFHLNAMH